MNIRLTGSAGTGESILRNWEKFSYNLDKKEYEYNRKCDYINKIPFNVQFGDQKGYMVISIENGQISQSTTIDCGFDRPLTAYNDTADFNKGLYIVAEKMLRESGIEL